MRLDAILSRRRLIFNPYTVSDSRLIEIVRSLPWGGEYDITEMTVMKFTRLRPTKDYREFDGIFMKTGVSTYERFKASDLQYLLGKDVFVSHVIKGVDFFGNPQMAYHMHRLHGKTAKDAAIIY